MAGDTDSPEREEVHANTLEVQRGETFFLFPKDRPILYRHKPLLRKNISEVPSADVVSPEIHVQGIEGLFSPNFSGDVSLYPGDLYLHLEWGEKIVLLTNDGPIDLVQSGRESGTSRRIEKDKYTELINWSIPGSISKDSGVEISFSTPNYIARYTQDVYYVDDEGGKYFISPIDDDGEEIHTLLVPVDPDFLRKIRVEIS